METWRHALALGLLIGGGCTPAPAPPPAAGDAGAEDGGALACPVAAGAAGAITAKADALRTGWYPDQPLLAPAVVGSAAFGRIFRTPLPLASPEVVLAQPLVFDATVFVATEANDLYALDAVTGAVEASRALGPSWKGATSIARTCRSSASPGRR